MRDKPARVARLFVEDALAAREVRELPEGAAHHAARVLRLRAGDALVLFDGRGGEYAATIESVERARITVRVGEHRALERETPLAVTLLQAVSSGEKMDTTIQKAIELGVAAIQPLLSEKSVVRLDPDRAGSKHAHWRRVAIAACEQCGRNRIPELLPARPLAECVRRADAGELRLLLSPRAPLRLSEAAGGSSGSIALAAGPEAGFSAAEEELLERAGFVPVRLGARVLRTETAALAALAALNALRGDY